MYLNLSRCDTAIRIVFDENLLRSNPIFGAPNFLLEANYSDGAFLGIDPNFTVFDPKFTVFETLCLVQSK
jgi:hypothetical protein